MKRRGFLKLLLTILGSIALILAGYPTLRFFSPAKKKAKTERLVLSKAELLRDNVKEVTFDNTPAIVINVPGKGLIALSRVCTHLGCLVSYEEERNILLCPCHAGIYDLEGNVISGPPPLPLPNYPLSIEGDKVIIG